MFNRFINSVEGSNIVITNIVAIITSGLNNFLYSNEKMKLTDIAPTILACILSLRSMYHINNLIKKQIPRNYGGSGALPDAVDTVRWNEERDFSSRHLSELSDIYKYAVRTQFFIMLVNVGFYALQQLKPSLGLKIGLFLLECAFYLLQIKICANDMVALNDILLDCQRQFPAEDEHSLSVTAYSDATMASDNDTTISPHPETNTNPRRYSTFHTVQTLFNLRRIQPDFQLASTSRTSDGSDSNLDTSNYSTIEPSSTH